MRVTKKLKCAVVTTSRADYGLMKWIISAISESEKLECAVIASGTHLREEHGFTVNEIIADGHPVSARVPIDMASSTDIEIADSMAQGISGFARAYEEMQPDLILVLGDRYEVFAAMSAATVCRIPLAHLCGGDVTEGAYDEVFRHSISKSAALHFPSNLQSARRLEQMGEPADRIFAVGSTALDALHKTDWLSRDEVFARLSFTPREKTIMVTHHPVTRVKGGAMSEISSVLAALNNLGPNYGIIFTGVNADSEGDVIAGQIAEFCKQRENAQLYSSLGQYLYMNTIRQVDAVVGNSSSGLYEVPSFKKPTVNIGNRQAGRLRAKSVINVPAETQKIGEAIQSALAMDCSSVVNPYGDGHSSKRLVEVLERFDSFENLLMKKFIDLECNHTIHEEIK